MASGALFPHQSAVGFLFLCTLKKGIPMVSDAQWVRTTTTVATE